MSRAQIFVLEMTGCVRMIGMNKWRTFNTGEHLISFRGSAVPQNQLMRSKAVTATLFRLVGFRRPESSSSATWILPRCPVLNWAWKP